MSPKKNKIPEWVSASPSLYEAYSDFILSREAMLCEERTVAWYTFSLDKVMEWMVAHGVTQLTHITARHVRGYLSDMVARGSSDSYVHNHARIIRTFLIFLYKEKYLSERIEFKMPTIVQMNVRFLTIDQIALLLKACNTLRDRVIITLMVDTGLRLAEVCALNWQDIDISSGLIRVVRGKGGKPRSVVAGATTRHLLISYRREMRPEPSEPVFRSRYGERLPPRALVAMLNRRGKEAGVKVNPHALRHSFATLSLRAGMSPLHLQGLLGHATMDMTNRYVHMVDDDLLEAHRAHGPIDNMLRKK